MALNAEQEIILRNLDEDSALMIIAEAKERIKSIEDACNIIDSKANNHFNVCLVILVPVVSWSLTNIGKQTPILTASIIFCCFVFASLILCYLSFKTYIFISSGYDPKKLLTKSIFYSEDVSKNKTQFLYSSIVNMEEAIHHNAKIHLVKHRMYDLSLTTLWVGIALSLLAFCFHNWVV